MAEKKREYGIVDEPYIGAVVVLIEEVEQRVRSPEHLCGRLMTPELQTGKTDRMRESLKQGPVSFKYQSCLMFAEGWQY